MIYLNVILTILCLILLSFLVLIIKFIYGNKNKMGILNQFSNMANGENLFNLKDFQNQGKTMMEILKNKKKY